MHEAERTPWLSRVLARMLDYRKPLDYLWLIAFAAAPIALAAGIGVLQGFDSFAGYWDRFQWPLLILVLPIATFGLRWTAKCIGPVSSRAMPPSLPPVVRLIESDAGKEIAYAQLRRALLSPNNLLAALLITLLIHVVDMAQLAGFYISDASHVCPSSEVSATPTATDCAQELSGQGTLPRLRIEFPWMSGGCCEVERDWSVAYLSSKKKVGKWQNLMLNVSAYSVQFAVVFIGILLVTLILRHNLYFLARVYQRRRVAADKAYSYVHIDLDDKDKCFGFRPANDAFNVQVLMLAIAAVFILTTRFANVGVSADGTPTGLFPDVGQLLAVLTWVVALFIVSLPILVKLLPRRPFQRTGSAPTSIADYLREFLTDEAWTIDNDTLPEEIDAVAAKFAENAFWPTGNNRAWQLYFLSFWVFFIALVPDPRAINGEFSDWTMFVGWLLAGALAWGATLGLFRFLRAMLTYIDNRLVELPAHPIGAAAAQRRRTIPIGVFISYRRDDTAAYTGRLYDSLSKRIDKNRLFMDLDKIPGGVDFVEAMNTAIDSAEAMIVVIGPKWLTSAHGDGPPRIQDPGDFVHQELALGLQRGIRVFPVLVGGATMPSESDLPEGLSGFALRNAREISDSRWSHDVGQLIEDLVSVPSAKRSKETK